jgi:hypothetical protein
MLSEINVIYFGLFNNKDVVTQKTDKLKKTQSEMKVPVNSRNYQQFVSWFVSYMNYTASNDKMEMNYEDG